MCEIMTKVQKRDRFGSLGMSDKLRVIMSHTTGDISYVVLNPIDQS